jgi:NADH dehydrogenase/NADH:ubiquinone oxidoreductase 75 kD subunit (chain G)
MIQAKINGIDIKVKEGTSILDAAKKVNINIPTLCKHPDLDATAACGICIVKVKGGNKMLRSCCTPLEKAWISSPMTMNYRKRAGRLSS